MLVPIGINFASTSRCTPNAFAIDPAICLYFLRSISAKDSNSTKKHNMSDIMSAKVPIHAGHVGLSSSFGSPIPASCLLNMEPTYAVVNLYAEKL